MQIKARLVCHKFLEIRIFYHTSFNIVLFINDERHSQQRAIPPSPETFPKGLHEWRNVKIRQQVKATPTQMTAVHVKLQLRISVLKNKGVTALQ